MKFTARLGASQSRLPLIPSPTTRETKATSTTPFEAHVTAPHVFQFINGSYRFFTASTYFMRRSNRMSSINRSSLALRLPRVFSLEHAENIDHLLRHRHVSLDFAAHGTGHLAQVHQRLRAKTDYESRKIDLGQRLM